MMYLPSLFGENLMDDWMEDFDHNFFGKRNPLYGKHAKNLMKTDIRETENNYELDFDLPGFKKDEITLTLKNGYLSVSATKALNEDQKDSDGRLIRQERYSGSMARSFYVGEALAEEDVTAKFEDGVLHIAFPKKEVKKEAAPSHRIEILG